MRTLLIVSLIAITLSQQVADPLQDCLKTQCSSQYNTCANAILSCAPKAYSCSNQCGTDADCLVACANASGNKQLIALANCGDLNCRNLSFLEQIIQFLGDPLQDCLKTQCSSQYNTCANAILSCAPKAYSCSNQCGTDADCLVACANTSGNKQLIALATCGDVNCRNLQNYGWNF